MNVPEKLRMARKLVDLGVDFLEAGFPIASEGDFEAVDAVSREFPVGACRRAGALHASWTWNAPPVAPHAKRPRIHTFIATSDIHLKYKLKKSRQQVLEEAVAAVELARTLRGRRRVLGRGRRAHRARITSKRSPRPWSPPARALSTFPDTVGYSVPAEYGALIGHVVQALGDTAIVSVHCHDDLGLAVANSIAAVEAGARQIECTINGIGERAGNCSLEEVVMILKTRADLCPMTPISAPSTCSPPARC